VLGGEEIGTGFIVPSSPKLTRPKKKCFWHLSEANRLMGKGQGWARTGSFVRLFDVGKKKTGSIPDLKGADFYE
jgi:hypothetical protein